MASFQQIILIIAIVLLLICVIFVAVSLNNKKNSTWPPMIPGCPDYWIDVSGNGSHCANPKHLGTCKTPSMDFSSITSGNTTAAANCAKYQWATNCGVAWEGITYGYGSVNPCQQTSSS